MDATFCSSSLKIVQSYDPHHILGLHTRDGKKVIRIWRPHFTEACVVIRGEVHYMDRVGKTDLFEFEVDENLQPHEYQVYHRSGLLASDPYAFSQVTSSYDLYLFNAGTHYELYRTLGARIFTHMGIEGVCFAVWAPNAKAIALVGDFNGWDRKVNPMRSLGVSGIWELFVPGLKPKDQYKFWILGANDEWIEKIDPFAHQIELRPKNGCVVVDIEEHRWKDAVWLSKRKKIQRSAAPLSIYELHLGSWKKDHSHFLNYRKIGEELARYVLEMGFTHVQFMPPMEHPLDESWGYQISGFFAPTSRHGNFADFQAMIDHLHNAGIGVILDWVPAHFPKDQFALAEFDGTSLFEHDDPRKGHHPHWGTLIFNYGRKEVANFLIASALFWIEVMHIDGLRFDAVASMLYLDYGREQGEWIPNAFGGIENLDAIEFLKHLNSQILERHPDMLLIAEESTSFPGVTRKVEEGGLGFTHKWNMGWMNDTLQYFQRAPFFRPFHQNELTFVMLYIYSERYVLPLSHDEVVHGKASLLSKMPGDDWQKFANLRLLLGYQFCMPGKKLLFMGAEIGQWDEWNAVGEIPWYLLQYERHEEHREFVQSLLHFYRENAALWEKDESFEGFEWINFSDTLNCTIAYLRKGKTQTLLCIHNFSPHVQQEYELTIPNALEAVEVFNSDRKEWGGSGVMYPKPLCLIRSKIVFTLSPLATQIFSIRYTSMDLDERVLSL